MEDRVICSTCSSSIAQFPKPTAPGLDILGDYQKPVSKPSARPDVNKGNITHPCKAAHFFFSCINLFVGLILIAFSVFATFFAIFCFEKPFQNNMTCFL